MTRSLITPSEHAPNAARTPTPRRDGARTPRTRQTPCRSSAARPRPNAHEVINSSNNEIALLRDRLAGAESFIDTLGAFVGAELHLDRPRRTQTALDDVQKVLLREAADIPHGADPTEIRSLVRGLYHRRSLVRAGGTVVASVESIVIPRRLPPGTAEVLFGTNLPLGKVLAPYGARRLTHDVGVRWWSSHDTPPDWDIDILRVTGQLNLALPVNFALPVAWLRETVFASALDVRRANNVGGELDGEYGIGAGGPRHAEALPSSSSTSVVEHQLSSGPTPSIVDGRGRERIWGGWKCRHRKQRIVETARSRARATAWTG